MKARAKLGMPIQHYEDSAGIEERLSALSRATDAVSVLSPEQRDAVQLRVVDEMSYDEVASRLGCTPGAARTRVSRGLRHLESALGRRTT
jgi:RNA polymerase sigma-70 factor (ECF subfamily)